MLDFQRRSLADFGAKLPCQLRSVIGEHRCFVAGAGDGDIRETGVEQVRMDSGVGVDEHPLGGEALSAVAGYGVAVIEMPVIRGIEF